MKNNNISKLLIAMLIFLAGVNKADAEIHLTDNFSVTGFLRYELAVHTGVSNPANSVVQDENNDFNLSRTFFQTEWTYKPCVKFKLFAKIRFIGDQTERMDNELADYNAFPLDVSKNDWTMMKASKDDYRFEVWELHADIQLGKLWLRLGKQPISWGEMIGLRLADQVQALETNWHLTFEPEEFENIRIPNWCIRGIYQFGQLGKISDFYVESFLNPGDITPNQGPVFGSPFNLTPPFPPFFRIEEKDRRGEREFGFRIGGMYKSFYATFMYLQVFDDSFRLKFKGLTPDPIFGIPILAPRDFTRYAMLLDATYPKLDIYGFTFNYDIPRPIGTVFTLEGTWVPDQPYGDARSRFPKIRDQGTFSYSFRLDRPTPVLPRTLFGTPVTLMGITLQFAQFIREGDNEKILGPGQSKIESTQEMIIFQVKQPLWYNNIELGFQIIYDLDDAYQIKPSFKYRYQDHWYFDLVGVFFGGAEDKPGRLGYLDFANEVFGRITYQF